MGGVTVGWAGEGDGAARNGVRATLRATALLGLVLAALLGADHLGWLPALAFRAVAVGFAGGLAGGLIAGAIGLVTVPLLTLFLGLPIHQAVATNLFQTIFTAASGARAHRRLGTVSGALAVPLLAGSLFGAPLGALVGIRLPEATLRGLFAVILALMALNLVRALVRGRRADSWWNGVLLRTGSLTSTVWWARPIAGEFRGHAYRVPRWLPVLLGAAVGFVSGLLGIGGGFLVTPLVGGILGVPTHLAVGTGLVVVSGNSVFGTVPHLLAGNVLVGLGLLLAVGGAAGARVGSRLGHRLPERALQAMFVVVLVVVAWRMSPW